MPPTDRWPSWIYPADEEPDYRFTLANERTLLAWVRTALALIGGGVALRALDTSLSSSAEVLISRALLGLGAVCVVGAWTR
jgi:putative membrane protein